MASKNNVIFLDWWLSRLSMRQVRISHYRKWKECAHVYTDSCMCQLAHLAENILLAENNVHVAILSLHLITRIHEVHNVVPCLELRKAQKMWIYLHHVKHRCNFITLTVWTFVQKLQQQNTLSFHTNTLTITNRVVQKFYNVAKARVFACWAITTVDSLLCGYGICVELQCARRQEASSYEVAFSKRIKWKNTLGKDPYTLDGKTCQLRAKLNSTS